MWVEVLFDNVRRARPLIPRRRGFKCASGILLVCSLMRGSNRAFRGFSILWLCLSILSAGLSCGGKTSPQQPLLTSSRAHRAFESQIPALGTLYSSFLVLSRNSFLDGWRSPGLNSALIYSTHPMLIHCLSAAILDHSDRIRRTLNLGQVTKTR